MQTIHVALFSAGVLCTLPKDLAGESKTWQFFVGAVGVRGAAKIAIGSSVFSLPGLVSVPVSILALLGAPSQ